MEEIEGGFGRISGGVQEQLVLPEGNHGQGRIHLASPFGGGGEGKVMVNEGRP